MNTTEQAQQLRLAAGIIETGHPWDLKVAEKWHSSSKYISAHPLSCIFHGQEIRLALATPPDGRPLHNPDNLTAEQVGAGYRLLTQDEFQKDAHPKHQEWWSVSFQPDTWVKEKTQRSRAPLVNYGTTYRLPLSVPWPEAPKPEPTFKLPPPPPGMKWHREDGWKEGDLPQGYRPLVLGETTRDGDSRKNDESWESWPMDHVDSADAAHMCLRTTRPLVFTHEGKEWTYHKPGDPMPCDEWFKIEIFYEIGGVNWDIETSVIGWRYAEPATKTVPLGPEDVPPGSVLKAKSWPACEWRSIDHIYPDGVLLSNSRRRPWAKLMQDYLINRSIPLTGKWDATAWEPCSKEVPA